jgi:predicted alpha/beta-hydrolase family hydrolase
MTYGLLLAPGAGADSSSPALVALDNALSPQLTVRRMDFPYRKAGRRAPDRQPVLVQAVLDEVSAFSDETGISPERIYLGGRSMGGRMCSIAVAEGQTAAGLVLISYPLHPPGRPENLRIAHFPDITVPCVFVSGTRDSFGTPDELTSHTAAISGSVDHVWIDGGDHSLRRKDQQVVDAVKAWFTKWMHD